MFYAIVGSSAYRPGPGWQKARGEPWITVAKAQRKPNRPAKNTKVAQAADQAGKSAARTARPRTAPEALASTARFSAHAKVYTCTDGHAKHHYMRSVYVFPLVFSTS